MKQKTGAGCKGVENRARQVYRTSRRSFHEKEYEHQAKIDPMLVAVSFIIFFELAQRIMLASFGLATVKE